MAAVRTVLRGIQAGSSWAALAVIGVLADVLAPAEITVLHIVGQIAVILGSAGVGAEIGRARADQLTKARLLPLFKSSNKAGRGLVRLHNEVLFARQDLTMRGTSNVPIKDAEAHLRAIAIRIDEQGADRVDALEDWRPLLADEVAEVEAKESGEGR